VATVLYQEQATDVAMLFTRMAVRLRPDFPIAQLLVADIMVEQGRTRDAIALFRSVADDPRFGWQAQLSEADGLDELGETEAAVALLRRLAAERPERIDAPLQLGNILRGYERFAEAAAAYDMAVARIKDPQPRHWSIFYFRGIALERSKDWARAEADFLKALELQPEQPYVMNYLAYSWIEMGQHYEKALDMLRRAVELRPQDGFIVDSLGWVYYRLGRYEEAVAKLEEAIELKPDDPVINDHLGDAYWKVGRRNEARFQWRRALTFEPEADQIGLIEEKIERGLSKEASGS
jgi:tetratricopeptide (TPR) repeat protein